MSLAEDTKQHILCVFVTVCNHYCTSCVLNQIYKGWESLKSHNTDVRFVFNVLLIIKYAPVVPDHFGT